MYKIPLNPTLKCWTCITSQEVLDELRNGGPYIRGTYQRNKKNMFRNDSAIKDVSEKQIKAKIPNYHFITLLPISIYLLTKNLNLCKETQKERTYTLAGLKLYPQ